MQTGSNELLSWDAGTLGKLKLIFEKLINTIGWFFAMISHLCQKEGSIHKKLSPVG